jgi:phage protein D
VIFIPVDNSTGANMRISESVLRKIIREEILKEARETTADRRARQWREEYARREREADRHRAEAHAAEMERLKARNAAHASAEDRAFEDYVKREEARMGVKWEDMTDSDRISIRRFWARKDRVNYDSNYRSKPNEIRNDVTGPTGRVLGSFRPPGF